MARITAERCDCNCKMKRLYIRAEGGKGWDGVGWLCNCGCGCVSIDEARLNPDATCQESNIRAQGDTNE